MVIISSQRTSSQGGHVNRRRELAVKHSGTQKNRWLNANISPMVKVAHDDDNKMSKGKLPSRFYLL